MKSKETTNDALTRTGEAEKAPSPQHAPTVREGWRVEPYYEDGRMIAARIMPPKPFTGPPVAEVWSTLTDANVMGAAPELLAALKLVHLNYYFADKERDVVIAAIAKAEGR